MLRNLGGCHSESSPFSVISEFPVGKPSEQPTTEHTESALKSNTWMNDF
jgi:hypothetical protein